MGPPLQMVCCEFGSSENSDICRNHNERDRREERVKYIFNVVNAKLTVACSVTLFRIIVCTYI